MIDGREPAAIEQHRDLMRGAELAVGAAPLVQEPEDVPFVVRAAAHRRRGAQRVVASERGFGEAAIDRQNRRHASLPY